MSTPHRAAILGAAIPSADKLVLLALDDGEAVTKPVETIAAETGLGASTIWKALKRLEAGRWLRVRRAPLGVRTANTYTVRTP